MSGVNRCIILGRLGKDPEVKPYNEKVVTSFSLAVSEKWTDKTTGEIKEQTEWISIVAFGKLAEIAGKFLKKGRQCYVEGKIKTDKYEKDGVTKYSTKIIADKIEFISEGKSADSEAQDVGPSPYDVAKASDAKPKAQPLKTAAGKKPHNYAPGADNEKVDPEFGF